MEICFFPGVRAEAFLLVILNMFLISFLFDFVFHHPSLTLSKHVPPLSFIFFKFMAQCPATAYNSGPRPSVIFNSPYNQKPTKLTGSDGLEEMFKTPSHARRRTIFSIPETSESPKKTYGVSGGAPPPSMKTLLIPLLVLHLILLGSLLTLLVAEVTHQVDQVVQVLLTLVLLMMVVMVVVQTGGITIQMGERNLTLLMVKVNLRLILTTSCVLKWFLNGMAILAY